MTVKGIVCKKVSMIQIDYFESDNFQVDISQIDDFQIAIEGFEKGKKENWNAI